MTGPYDTVAAIILYATNESKLYHRHFKPAYEFERCKATRQGDWSFKSTYDRLIRDKWHGAARAAEFEFATNVEDTVLTIAEFASLTRELQRYYSEV